METILETENSKLTLYSLDAEVMQLIAECVSAVDGELDLKPEIELFGKLFRQKRDIGFFSDESRGYAYSSTIAISKPMPACLIALLQFVNTTFDANYNGILVNKYADGTEYIGKHSDDVRELNPRIGVLCISYGAVRNFRIRDKATGKIVANVPTHADKIMQMSGQFQREFTHEIPIQKKVLGARYSFTFRKHLR